ncbi:MAG: hypothetical protein ABEN55_23225 [Bradymonadaceae bacterium]
MGPDVYRAGAARPTGFGRNSVEHRISRNRLAIEMQKVVKRQKGGWLVDKYT